MASSDGIVIVGSGLAGYTLAREFRKLDQQTPVTIITRDGGEAYSKPMLSNALSKAMSDAALVQKSVEQVKTELGLTVLNRTEITQIDRNSKSVTLADNAKIGYDRLVLALGADARPTGLGDVVKTVNDLDDFRSWRAKLDGPKNILVIGAGLVGCEFANDLVIAGHKVTIVDPAPWPLGRLLPPIMGEQIALALRAIGIDLHLNTTVSSLDHTQAVLSDGSTIAFDQALSAIGLIPRTSLAAQANLTVDKGIVVDRRLQTSDPSIFALGDCAQSPAGLLPFVLPLMAQARTLADVLHGGNSQLKLAALPVVVKTPCLPLAVCSPGFGIQGDWQVEGEGQNLKALFVDKSGAAQGFVVSGSRAAERMALAKTMPDILG